MRLTRSHRLRDAIMRSVRLHFLTINGQNKRKKSSQGHHA